MRILFCFFLFQFEDRIVRQGTLPKLAAVLGLGGGVKFVRRNWCCRGKGATSGLRVKSKQRELGTVVVLFGPTGVSSGVEPLGLMRRIGSRYVDVAALKRGEDSGQLAGVETAKSGHSTWGHFECDAYIVKAGCTATNCWCPGLARNEWYGALEYSVHGSLS